MQCKILIIGAGGTGTELLKLHYLNHMSDITLVDLDTISLTNLNRQFLFNTSHIGHPKSHTAARVYTQMMQNNCNRSKNVDSGTKFTSNNSNLSKNVDSDTKFTNSNCSKITNNTDDNDTDSTINSKKTIYNTDNNDTDKPIYISNQTKNTINKNISIKDNINNTIDNNNYIVSHFESIYNFTTSFLRQFDLIYTCLDNENARSYIITRCLFLKIPVVDGGSAGFLGQAWCYDDSSECYECVSRSEKVYSVCSVRSVPERYEHCVIWAKTVFFDEIMFTLEDKYNVESEDSIECKDNTDYSIDVSTDFNYNTGSKYDIGIIQHLGSNVEHNHITQNNETNTKKRYKSEDLTHKHTIKDDRKSCTEYLQSLICNQNYILNEKDEEILLKICAIIKNLKKRESIIFDKDDTEIMSLIHNLAVLRSKSFLIESGNEIETSNIAGNIIPALCTTNSIVASLMFIKGNKKESNTNENGKNDSAIKNNISKLKESNKKESSNKKNSSINKISITDNVTSITADTINNHTITNDITTDSVDTNTINNSSTKESSTNLNTNNKINNSTYNYFLSKGKKIINKVKIKKWNDKCNVCSKRKYIFTRTDKTRLIEFIKLMNNEIFGDLSIYTESKLLYDEYFEDNLENELTVKDNEIITVRNEEETVLVLVENGSENKLVFIK
ncbi:E1 ubiquitin-activating protein uba2 [Conglomerata obtusa]